MFLFSWYDSKIANNDEQKQAVKNIVLGTSHPYPYLVFGPPGTGKTVTLVESIKQVHYELISLGKRSLMNSVFLLAELYLLCTVQ